MTHQYSEIKVDCPVCGKKAFVIRSLIYNIPSYGETLLISGKCESCGYRFTFTTPYKLGKGRVIEFVVKEPEDFNTLLYIGENTDIEIPEIGFQFLSTEYEPGFITTVEGLLLRIKERLEILCEGMQCNSYMEKINRGIEGKIMLTLRLIDRYGRSEIFSNKTVIKEINE